VKNNLYKKYVSLFFAVLVFEPWLPEAALAHLMGGSKSWTRDIVPVIPIWKARCTYLRPSRSQQVRVNVHEDAKLASFHENGHQFHGYPKFSVRDYNRSHNPRLTHGCLFASGHHGPTVDTFERERCSLVSVL